MISQLTDSELIELAAKAIGLDIGPGLLFTRRVWKIMRAPRAGLVWNPLADDGDAFRLAVALGDTGPLREKVLALSIGCGRTACEFNYVDHGQDAAAATRRAIVIAAAIVGANLR